jgi:hypothetical protein
MLSACIECCRERRPRSTLPLLALTGMRLPARRATAINPTEALRAE